MKIRVPAPRLLEGVLRWTSRLLVSGGLVALGVYVWSESDRRVYQAIQAARLEPVETRPEWEVLGPLAQPPRQVPWRTLVKPDPAVIGRLEVPRLKLNAIVRRGIDEMTLRRAVGHMPGTALPGAAGNAILVGHRDGLFRPLRGIERGDAVVITTPARRFTYRVEGLSIVGPDAMEVTGQDGDERVTLITCYPFDYVGAAPRRLIVSASRTD